MQRQRRKTDGSTGAPYDMASTIVPVHTPSHPSCLRDIGAKSGSGSSTDTASKSSLTPDGMQHVGTRGRVCCRLVEVVDAMPSGAEATEGMRRVLQVLESIRAVVEVVEDVRHVLEMPVVMPDVVEGCDMCVGGWGAFPPMVVSGRRLVLEFGGGESVVMLLALAALARLLPVLLALGCRSCSGWYW